MSIGIRWCVAKRGGGVLLVQHVLGRRGRPINEGDRKTARAKTFGATKPLISFYLLADKRGKQNSLLKLIIHFLTRLAVSCVNLSRLCGIVWNMTL